MVEDVVEGEVEVEDEDEDEDEGEDEDEDELDIEEVFSPWWLMYVMALVMAALVSWVILTFF